MSVKTDITRRVYLIFFLFLFQNFILLSQINDIKVFLDLCPNNDPAINTILSDFEIRLNGVKVNSFPCTEPVSAMTVADYANPLIYLQTLRVIYYMDRGMTGKHLPWTDKSLYDWMKDNVDGVDIRDGVIGGYCCEVLDSKNFFVTGVQDDNNREFDKGWRGISGNIDFFAHEVRHTNGNGYPHSSCCGIENGCDNEYNETDLGSYGIQYWLNKSWLNGDINVGARTTASQNEINDIINWYLNSLNYGFRTSFCYNQPAMINLADIVNPLGSIPTFAHETVIKEVKIYPNPISRGSNLTIDIPDASFCRFEIINTSGVTLKTIDNNGGKVIISMDLKPDVYILRMQDYNGGSYYQKMIVN